MKDDKPFRVETEIDFAIECIIHGNQSVSGNVRALPLGHGRAYIDLAGSQCRKCGSSINLTIRVVPTKWEDIPADKVRALMRAALEAEAAASGVLIDAEPELDEEPKEESEADENEEVTEDQPKPSPIWGPWGADGVPQPGDEEPTRPSPFGGRPRLQ